MFNKKNKKKVYIEGMMCEHCAKKVTTTLQNIPNITKVKVDLKAKYALITYSDSINESLIKEEISKLDYKVIKIEGV